LVTPLADRADAVQIWEPAYTLLLAKKPDIRTLDQSVEKTWSAFAGGSRIPYLGLDALRIGSRRTERSFRDSTRRTNQPRNG
jgi:hypothetical protein